MARDFLKMSSALRLASSVRRVRGAYASMGPELEKANEAAVTWLNQRALEHLTKAIESHGRPQRESARLINVLEGGNTSTFTRRGFRFGAYEKMNASNAGIYWRNLEFGSNIFVGRETRAIWIDPGGAIFHPSQSAYPYDARMPNDWKGAFLGRGGWPVRIQRPIPAYHYMGQASADFETEGIYILLLAQASQQWRDVLTASAATGLSPKRVRALG
jgi:hypothetical protein